jgi:hypothetical protein
VNKNEFRGKDIRQQKLVGSYCKVGNFLNVIKTRATIITRVDVSTIKLFILQISLVAFVEIIIHLVWMVD